MQNSLTKSKNACISRRFLIIIFISFYVILQIFWAFFGFKKYKVFLFFCKIKKPLAFARGYLFYLKRDFSHVTNGQRSKQRAKFDRLLQV